MGVEARQLRIDFRAEMFHTLVLESHAVQHAGGGLRHARIVVAFSRMQGGSFHDEAAESVQIDEVCELKSVAEGAGSGQHGVLQGEVANFYV